MSARVHPIMKLPYKDAHSLLHEQARAWRVRLNSGKVTPDEAQAFKLWCQQSDEHARAWRETSATWSLLSDTLKQPPRHVQTKRAKLDDLFTLGYVRSRVQMIVFHAYAPQHNTRGPRPARAALGSLMQ